jgi:hypothetical protein
MLQEYKDKKKNPEHCEDKFALEMMLKKNDADFDNSNNLLREENYRSSRQELISPRSLNSSELQFDNISEVKLEGDIRVPNTIYYPSSGSKEYQFAQG